MSSEQSETGALPSREQIESVLRTVYDPEIPVNIYDMGLIYDIAIDDKGGVDVKMTLTAPSCPAAGMLPPEVETKVRSCDGVTDARIELVWDPPWDPSRMTEEAKLQLGMF